MKELLASSRDWLAKSAVRRLLITIAVIAMIELITGPPGSNDAPVSGFSGSFAEHASFFGLVGIPRWVLFLFFALIAYGVASYWLTQGHRVKAVLHERLAVPRKAVGLRPTRYGALGLLLLLAILLPHLVHSAFWQEAMVEQIAVYVLLAIGLNVVVGFAGLLDLGYVAFYAIGAYATAWITGALPTPPLFHHVFNNFYAIPIAIFIVMAFGVLLGAPTLRLRGDYLAIVTLGFGEIVTIFLNNLYGITGGSLGTHAIPHPRLDLGFFKYVWSQTPQPYYYLTLVFIVIFLIVFSLLEHSRVGRAWTAIREDEVAAQSIGINPLKYKVMAFAIGAASAGFAGVITASQLIYLFPASFTLQFSINILVLVILGGMGSIAGAVFGAIVIQTISMYLNNSPPSGYQQSDLYIYIGALLIAMMIFRPAGLIPSRRRRREIEEYEEHDEGHPDEVLLGLEEMPQTEVGQ